MTRRSLRQTRLGAALAVATVVPCAVAACSPKHVDDTIVVTLRLTAGDAGAVGLQCGEPVASPLCDDLRACGGQGAQCAKKACIARGTCGAELRACLDRGDIAPKECIESICTTARLDRARAPGSGTYVMSVVIDYIRLGGIPSCLPNQLRAWCAEKRGAPGICRPLPVRRCVDVVVAPPAGASRVELSTMVAEQVRAGGLLDPGAPNDEGVLVRMVAMHVNGGCASLSDSTRSLLEQRDGVLGCARSCPVTLNVAQEVALDFDSTTCTEDRMFQCADFIGTASPDGGPSL